MLLAQPTETKVYRATVQTKAVQTEAWLEEIFRYQYRESDSGAVMASESFVSDSPSTVSEPQKPFRKQDPGILITLYAPR
jgi:hypothetical protein